MRWTPTSAAVALGLIACNSVYGTDDLTFGETSNASSAASGGATASVSVSSSSSSSSASAGGGGMGGGGGIGGSGGGAVCGDMTIGKGEECDDGNDIAGDGCEDCNVVCAAPGEVKLANDHCYFYSTATETTIWLGARAACMAWGGDLMAITSDLEQDWAASVITERSWIGATDIAVEGTFVWSNDEPWGYENWDAGEPNNMALGSGGGPSLPEHCGELFTSGFWNDARCGSSNPYLCERHPPGS